MCPFSFCTLDLVLESIDELPDRLIGPVHPHAEVLGSSLKLLSLLVIIGLAHVGIYHVACLPVHQDATAYEVLNLELKLTLDD